MTTYTVYMPPEGTRDHPEENFRLVPDAKATLALIFPPFWLAWHKLWLPLMVYFIVIFTILMIAVTSPSIAVSYLSILPGLYLLLEGYELVRKDLEQKGWQYVGVIEGDNYEEAEIRFLVEFGGDFIKPKSAIRNTLKSSALSNGSKQTNMSLFPE